MGSIDGTAWLKPARLRPASCGNSAGDARTQSMPSPSTSPFPCPALSPAGRSALRWRALAIPVLLGCLSLPATGCFSIAVRIPAQVKGTQPDPGTALAAAAADVVTAPLQLPLIVAAGIGEIRRRSEPQSPSEVADAHP